MGDRILITGGAGFIGSHLARHLLADGHEVRALDNLTDQVHPDRTRPPHLDTGAELIVGDIRNGDTVAKSLAA